MRTAVVDPSITLSYRPCDRAQTISFSFWGRNREKVSANGVGCTSVSSRVSKLPVDHVSTCPKSAPLNGKRSWTRNTVRACKGPYMRSRFCPHTCFRSSSGSNQPLRTGRNDCGIGSKSGTPQCTQPGRQKRHLCRAGTNLTSNWNVLESPGFPKGQLICVGISKNAFMDSAQCIAYRTYTRK